ncbi:MAG: D-alanine--D-alanine ligase [Nitrospirae bacterium]|nr:D-alanine--D-alanine ligase [Nitrospirota bacterium]
MTKGPVTTKRIGVLMGGSSSERDISMRSGLAIYQSLQELGYNVVPVDAGKDIVSVLKKDKVRFAFLALHGGLGENGAIQGLLEVLDIPYTGSGILASALAMDKEASKKIFAYHGLPVAPFTVVSRQSLAASKRSKSPDPQPLPPDFPLPWVVKPAAEGSSIGISIVKEQAAFMPALEHALSFGKRAIIEKFIDGPEVHIAVLGNKVLGGVEVKPSLEFYNYEAKYTAGLTEYIIPPVIDEPTYEKAKGIALQAHNALGCAGASRVDLKIDSSGIPFILEVNTLPGMTATSLLPKIAQAAGMNFKNLIEEIITLALKEQ